MSPCDSGLEGGWADGLTGENWRTGRGVGEQSGQGRALSLATSTWEGQSHRPASWKSRDLTLILTLGAPCWEVSPL